MPEKKDLKMNVSGNCHCCPYGFHIDRDFVRFCDSLYNNSSQLEKLRQHKRERRKQKKTVESYLGLTNISTDTNLQKIADFSSTSPHDLNLQSDGLNDAVLDFETTWQRSLKRNSSNDNQNGFQTLKTTNAGTENSLATHEKNQEFDIHDVTVLQSRSSSTSSISSRSTTASSIGIQVSSVHSITQPECMSQQMTVLSQTGTSYTTVGIQRSVLTNMREQIATSLNRMKDLEEQVKSIPILKVKLSALKEEKQSLLNQLNSKQKNTSTVTKNTSKNDLEKQLKKLENEGIMSPTLTRKCLSSGEGNLACPTIASPLNASISRKYFTEIKKNYKNTVDQKSDIKVIKTMKNAGTSCNVLTRDIGIGHVPNKSKSIGVGNDSIFNRTSCSRCSQKERFGQFTSLSSESIESDTDSVESPNIHSSDSFTYERHFKSRSMSKNFTNCRDVKKLVHTSCGTDIYYAHKSINTDIGRLDIVLKSELDNRRKLLKSRSTNTYIPLSTKSAQTSDRKYNRHIGVQTLFETKEEVILEKCNLQKVIKCDASVGELNINDFSCEKCSKEKKSIAIGNFRIQDIVCDKHSIKTVSVGCGNASIRDVICDKCILRQTETVGVGDMDVNFNACDNCEQMKTEKNLDKVSVKTNTCVDSLSNLNISKSGIHICDKCSATIHSVAQDLAGNNNESKIPKLNVTIPVVKGLQKTKLTKLQTYSSKYKTSTEKFSVNVSHILAKGNEENSRTQVIDRSLTTIERENEFKDKSSESEKEGGQEHAFTKMIQLPALSHVTRKKVQLNKELRAACKVLNDYLQKPNPGSEKKILSSVSIIQNEWFKIANQKTADPLLIEDYLDAFEEFSKALLHRIVNLSDSNGNTALHYAVSYGNFDVVSILIDSKVCDVNKQNKAGYTSIMLVALAEMKNDAHHYVVQRLFSIGDINLKATQNGQTALMLAVSHGKKDIVKMLLEVGSETNLQDKDGSTALMCAAEHGHLDIVKLLLSHPECDPSIVDGDECNALTIAMEAGHKDIGLLIYANMNFSRGSSPYSSLKTRKRTTTPSRTPTLRTPPPPSPSARSTSSIPSSFHFPS